MPAQPTYTEIESFAKKLTDRGKQQYGVCLRGKPGWGENMAFVDTAGEHVRRPLVQREVAAAARHASRGMTR